MLQTMHKTSVQSLQSLGTIHMAASHQARKHRLGLQLKGEHAWSIAQGTRHRMPFFAPNMCGKESEKAGAACIAGNMTFPMLSLAVRPKIERTWLQLIMLRGTHR